VVCVTLRIIFGIDSCALFDRVHMDPFQAGSDRVNFRIGSALLVGIGPVLLTASRVMLLRNGHQHTAWILLQDTEKLNLVKYIPSVTVVRSEYDLQVFCGHRIKFEWLIRCL